jgi:histidinol dehydrogenase
MRIWKTEDHPLEVIARALAAADSREDEKIDNAVKTILEAVAQEGDEALRRYTLLYDGADLAPEAMEATALELKEAAALVSRDEAEIISFAARRIEEYHRHQLAHLGSGSWSCKNDAAAQLGQVVSPLMRVGLYAPGGRAAYPSSVLMAAIPAKVAGVKELILVSPLREGRLNPLVAQAALVSQVDRVFKIGGAQAIAALAFGTGRIPRVDKIVGPGNAYVAAAKRLVFGRVAIDMIAGPSEIVIIADASADPVLVAADLIAQAEHDELARSILITTAAGLIDAVLTELSAQLSCLPRREIAGRSLQEKGGMVVCRDLAEAMELSALLAPEHLEIMTSHPEAILDYPMVAGCVFLGAATAETLGDYVAGSNHILPTSGTARFSSPLGVYDFQRRTSIVSYGTEGCAQDGPAAARFARLEGLEGHARSIDFRLARRR